MADRREPLTPPQPPGYGYPPHGTRHPGHYGPMMAQFPPFARMPSPRPMSNQPMHGLPPGMPGYQAGTPLHIMGSNMPVGMRGEDSRERSERSAEEQKELEKEVAGEDDKEKQPVEYAQVGYKEIFKQFILLGWTAFGGPAAHIALFQKVFIEKLHWISAPLFMELFALGQCIPGPTSTQVSFALGLIKKGIPGGLLSGMLFQYPGLVMMSLIGFAADFIVWDTDWLKGLTAGLAAVGVALVVGAAFGLSVKVCPDRETRFLNLLAAVLAYMYQSQWLFPAIIAFGGLLTIARDWKKPVKEAPGKEGIESLGATKIVGGVLVLIWAALLATVISLRNVLTYEGANKGLFWFESFFRSGSIIFGGGQVVLPLLLNEVTRYENVCTLDNAGRNVCQRTPDYQIYPEDDPRIQSWITEEQFLAGLAISQAMPGPLFNFSAFLGALIAQRAGQNAIVGIVCAWFGLFGPGILLIFGLLPFWGEFRKLPIYRMALPGMNAAAVGLVVAAAFSLYDTARRTSPFPDTSVAIGMLGFAFVEIFKGPAPLAVICGGILGVIAWAIRLKWILD